MAAVLNFMEDPLVTWVRTFSAGEPVDFQDISDGVYLFDVLCQIDHRGNNDDVNRVAKDTNARIKNWSILFNRLKSYYQDVLQQLIVMELPSITGIVKEPTKEVNLEGLRKVLLLLLGCSVQCEEKEQYVHQITQLDLKTQEAIVEHIKEVTDITDLVIPLDLPELDEAYRNIYRLLRKLASERDKYIENVVTVTQERDYYQAELEEKRGPLTPPNHLEKYHLIKELNKHKAKVNTLAQDIDDKSKGLSELKDELTVRKSEIATLRKQNLDLQKTARTAQAYRDELDTLKEKAAKVEKYEKDITRYKERINELDFYKCRVEELREDNTVLSEGRTNLEEQLNTANKRCEHIMDELVKAQLQYEEAHNEKENLQCKMQELFDENAALEFEHSNMSESQYGMRRMLSVASLTSSQLSLAAGHHGKNISDELKDSVTAHLSKMEQDNDSLRHQLEEVKQKLATSQRDHEKTTVKLQHELQQKIADLEHQTREIRHEKSKELTKEFEAKVIEMDKQSSELKRRISHDYKQRMTALEEECKHLKNQVGVLQEKWSRDREQYQHLEKVNKDLNDEKEQFRKTLGSLQESSVCKLKQLEDSVNSMQNGASVLQTRNDRINNLCVEDINKDNAKYILMREDENSYRPTPVARSSIQRSLNSSRHSINSLSELTGGGGTPQPQQQQTVTMRNKPAKGIVTPLRHSVAVESPAPRHSSSSFHRDDHLRTSVTPSRPKSEVQPFTRNSQVRQSMPERKMMYVVPERRSRQPISSTPRHHQSMESIKPYTPSSLSKEKSRSRESFTDKLGRFMNFKSSKTDINSDRDSGHATSPEISPSLDDSRDSNQLMTSISIVSSETIRTQMRANPQVRMTDKWKMFVDKIVDLQDKNQQLIVENSQLRRDFAKLMYATERLDKLEGRNLQLEVENRKLTKIIEMLQGSGRNPHDNRLYHYYSNV